MMNLDRILAAIDFTPVSQGAAAFALQLATKRRADIHLLTVDVTQKKETSRRNEPDALLVETSQRFHERRRDLLAEANKSGNELTMRHKTVRDSTPASGIIRYAEEYEIDLIVTGTEGRRGVRRLLQGSVAAEVVRTAPCPVLTVRTDEGNPPEAVHKIVVPVDFSPPSRGAVRYGSALADLFGAKLYVVHVMESIDDAEGYGLRPSVFGAAEGYKRIQEALEKLTIGLPVATTMPVLEGRPAEEITAFAVEEGIDLIIMPTRGQSGLQRLLMGSVAESVISTAPCPVLSGKDFDPYLQMEGFAA